MKIPYVQGRLGGSVGWVTDFSSGHDLAVCGFEPRVGLCADTSEPGGCFKFCLPLSLCPSHAHVLSLSLSLKNKHQKKIKGRLGGSVGWASNFSSGHDLAVREFEPCIWLYADTWEPGACFGFCVFPSLYPSLRSLSLSLSLKNKHQKGAPGWLSWLSAPLRLRS